MSTAIIQGATGGLGSPLIRFLLTQTKLNVIGLTSKSSSTSSIQQVTKTLTDGIKGEVGDRLKVVGGVDLMDEGSVERAREEVEEVMKGKKDVRLLVCLAGEVCTFILLSTLIYKYDLIS